MLSRGGPSAAKSLLLLPFFPHVTLRSGRKRNKQPEETLSILVAAHCSSGKAPPDTGNYI